MIFFIFLIGIQLKFNLNFKNFIYQDKFFANKIKN